MDDKELHDAISQTINESEQSAPLVPEVVEDLPRKKRYFEVHKEEKPEHRHMYSYYEKMGSQRSYRKVAKEFGKSVQSISILARRFDWPSRIKTHDSVFRDPISTLTKPSMDNARIDIVKVVSEISTILYEMTELSQAIRKRGSEDLSATEKKKMNTLINALSVYGIKIKSPKDLRDMIGALKDVMQFNKESSTPDGALKRSPRVNVREMNLIIQDD